MISEIWQPEVARHIAQDTSRVAAQMAQRDSATAKLPGTRAHWCGVQRAGARIGLAASGVGATGYLVQAVQVQRMHTCCSTCSLSRGPDGLSDAPGMRSSESEMSGSGFASLRPAAAQDGCRKI